MLPTHEVLNQPTLLVNYNLYETDEVLKEALRREGAGWAEKEASDFGRLMGTEEVIRWGFQANENPPSLKTHDRFGNRIDEVEFHPAWHEVMKASMQYQLHNRPWRERKEGAHVARAAMMMLAAQNEYGHLCPISMTYSSVPALRVQPEIAAEWEPRLRSVTYDPVCKPAGEKRGVLIGMAMTEKQGGSDVRANTTKAVPVNGGGPGKEYLLTGHKWFCSAPMSDAFLVLAQAPGGLSCFLLPRWTQDGRRNGFFIQRLKDKLGNRSNASAEVEFGEAWARLIGEEGKGVSTIIEMVMHTRLDCVIGSTAILRQGVAQAMHHCRHRSAFGKKLVDQPLMKNVLADLSLESEAATILMMRLARAFDRREKDPSESAFQRLATAFSKYWVCKRAPSHIFEALECLGGNGFVEESPMPRHYREAPLNSIWEGSGNVNALDISRAISREPETLEAVLTEIRKGRGGDRRLDAFIGSLETDLKQKDLNAIEARRLAERLALALQGSLVVQHSPSFVADAFLASRLSGDWGKTFGTLPSNVNFDAVIERGFPEP